jgi:hypothetical protein
MSELMETAPRDGTVISAWHVVWKCWLPIKWDGESPDTPWIEATLVVSWPENSFSCWVNHPEPPGDNKVIPDNICVLCYHDKSESETCNHLNCEEKLGDKP